MASLAWRNLFHDKVRFSVTLTGIVFAIVLIIVQIGLFLGFSTATTAVIDHSGADLWIGSKHVPYIETGAAFSERKLYPVLATPGVQTATKYVVRWSQWKRADGSNEGVLIVGFNPDQPLGGPWNIVAGSVAALKAPDAVMIDTFYQQKLQVTHLGQVVEIDGRRARVVGFTQGIRSFTTSPYVFTTFKNGQNYAQLREDQTIYILVKAVPGTEIAALKRRLAALDKDVDVFTTAEFSRRTRFYWMFTTGAGIAVLLAALMGLVVGVVVVAQTIYATTMDHLREFGTLKAMGASNRYIYRVILKQAVLSAVIGYAVALVVSVFVVRGSESGGAAILFPWELGAVMFFVALAMCIGASVVSINKVTKLDPAMVFKG